VAKPDSFASFLWHGFKPSPFKAAGFTQVAKLCPLKAVEFFRELFESFPKWCRRSYFRDEPGVELYGLLRDGGPSFLLWGEPGLGLGCWVLCFF
jgi:hypothetical protein